MRRGRFWPTNSRSEASISKAAAWCCTDVSSSYVEGRCCDLAAFGYKGDRKKGKMQIVYELLCATNGCAPHQTKQDILWGYTVTL